MPPRRRSIDDEEIAIIRGLLQRGVDKTKIQAYFTHPDRPVNFGRITNIERGTYGAGIAAATGEDVDRFLAEWNDRRGATVEAIVETALDLSTLPPTDPRRLDSFFARGNDGTWRLTAGETDEIECKRSFGLGGKTLRAVAALANNRGRYIFFGVADEAHVVVGLKNPSFQETDSNRFSQAFRSAMEPAPRFDRGICTVGEFTVGVLYVHQERDGPVIASKTEQEFREGTIYYRYAGESRAIGAAEFRRLLTERDRRIRQESGTNIVRLMDLGPRASVIDMSSSTPEAVKIVREGIDEADVLRNFVRQEKVELPLAYFLRSCSTARSWLPIFYYDISDI